MDILNFISWIKGGRQVTTVDASKTLIPLGLKDDRRDDGYLAGAITVEDFAAQLTPPAPEPAYKVYTASLTQRGTDPAVVIVLENTIDPGITFNALGNGNFEIISPLGVFTLNKTVGFPVMFGDDNDSPLVSYTVFSDVTGTYGALYVRRIDGTFASTIGDNSANLRCPIEIRVYN